MYFAFIPLLVVPLSLAESFYKDAIHPREATLRELEKLIQTLHSKSEITREEVESASKTYFVEPNKQISRLTLIMGNSLCRSFRTSWI